MSKIALEGNASGTGTLTIASQNTNSNFTLTLPNETGTIITSGSTTGINADAITSGTLTVARGGTGANTLASGAVVLGNGTSAVTTVAAGANGNVLTSNGTTWTSAALPTSGGDYAMNVYSTPGTWTKPAGLKAVKVTVVGGGGGSSFTGRCGGGGGTSIEYIDAPAIPGPQPYSVGSGGIAGTIPGGGPGGTGGTSSFGGPTAFLSATGGTGGSVPSNTSSGGAGSNGQMNFTGSSGFLITVIGGCTSTELFTNGTSLLANGPQTWTATNGTLVGGTAGLINPVAPYGYGVGGFGRVPSADIGIAGSGGVVIVEEFY